jgi:hypothetical protein
MTTAAASALTRVASAVEPPFDSSTRMSAICSGRLAFTEHDLGKAGAQVAVGVDARELERPERKLAQLL